MRFGGRTGRRHVASAALLAGPLLLGAIAWFVAPHDTASAAIPSRDPRTIYLADCATCHGADGAGTTRGPSLIHVGAASVDFYLTTGRMPLNSPHQAVQRQKPKYDPRTIRELVAYVVELTGDDGPHIPPLHLATANIATGGVIYRLNCAACHAWSGRGGALLHREAPPVTESTPQQIAQAVRIGPGNMPAFGQAAITDNDLGALVKYTHNLSNDSNNRGGNPLWHIGPLAEGAVAVFAGVALLLLLARAIGTRA